MKETELELELNKRNCNELEWELERAHVMGGHCLKQRRNLTSRIFAQPIAASLLSPDITKQGQMSSHHGCKQWGWGRGSITACGSTPGEHRVDGSAGVDNNVMHSLARGASGL